MRTRTKIAVGGGLLALVAGVMLVPRKPQVELSFVRYTNIGATTGAILGVTNHGVSVTLAPNDHVNNPLLYPVGTNALALRCPLPGRSGMQFVAWGSMGTVISVRYWPDRGILMRLLGMEPNTGRVVTVNLPPR